MIKIRSLTGKARIALLKAGAALILGGGIATTAISQPPPMVGTSIQSQHSFLTFSAGNLESEASAKNYYSTIDPGNAKLDFRDWLVNAGFISTQSEWKPTGQQTYTNVPGDYGPGKINAFAHIIILNAADLGFIRNQYIRCKPDCKTRGATIYTYLENYQPTQVDRNGIAQTSNAAAVSIALERRTDRIADVAFEWTPAPDGSNPGVRYGKMYAYVVQPKFSSITCPAPNGPVISPVLDADGNPVLDELYTWPSDNGNDQQFWDCKFNTRSLTTAAPEFLNPRPEYLVQSGDIFAPELDKLGTKYMPGVCMICHGGNDPKYLSTTNTWPNGGNVKEFKFLPADADNSIFGADDTAGPLVPGAVGSNMTRAGQEIELKKYNQAVLITQGASPPKTAVFAPDGTITGGNWAAAKTGGRFSHGVEVILGWYAGRVGDLSMSASVQNGAFVPLGWQATTESKALYLNVVAPSCRSCHMNREQSLDFGTQAQFDSNKGNIQDYVFQPECDSNNNEVNPNAIVMPLAKLTWDRFWQGIDPATNLPYPAGFLAPDDPRSQAFQLKRHFGYTATSFCATPH